MKNKIPFSLVPFNRLKKMSSVFLGLGNKIEKNLPLLKLDLEKMEVDASPQEYIAMCMMASLMFLAFSFIVLTTFWFFLVDSPILLSLIVSVPMSMFIFFKFRIWY